MNYQENRDRYDSIKFRIFNTDLKEMIYIDSLFRMIPSIYNPENNISMGVWEMVIQGKYPIMQYTGFNDKNGKKIYDGDILNKNDSFFVIYHGKYSYDRCCELDLCDVGFYYDFKSGDDSLFIEINSDVMDCIVSGNIYQK